MAADKSEKSVNTSQVRKQPMIVWDTANMQSVYANVFNVTGSQEEFVLSFGMNQSWGAEQKELKVQLTDRIVMSPFSAKRLAKLLNDVIKEYESRYGTLKTETIRAGQSSVQKMQSRDIGISPDRISKASG